VRRRGGKVAAPDQKRVGPDGRRRLLHDFKLTSPVNAPDA
jgi:hypothetical protein